MLSFANVNRDVIDIRQQHQNEFEYRKEIPIEVPRLDLNISDDESDFDHINKLFSIEEQNQGVEACSTSKDVLFTMEARGNDGGILSERTAKQSYNRNFNINANVWQHKDYRIKENRLTLLRHLKLLESLEDRREGKIDKIIKGFKLSKERATEHHTGKTKWWKKNVTEEEMLKISLHSLDRYFQALSMKLSEIKRLTDDLDNERANSYALKQTIDEYEKKIAQVPKKNDEDHKYNQNSVQKMKLNKHFQAKKPHEENEKQRKDTEKCKGRNKHKINEILKKTVDASKQLGKLMSIPKEEKRLYERDEEKQRNKPEESTTEAQQGTPGNIQEIKQMSRDQQQALENLLHDKQAENVKLSQKLIKVEEHNRDVIRSLREEILSKEKHLVEVQRMYEYQRTIAQLYKATLSNSEEQIEAAKNDCNTYLHDKIPNNRAEDERGCDDVTSAESSMLDAHLIDLHPLVKSIDSLEMPRLKKCFIETMQCQNSNTSMSNMLKEFPASKVKETWKEQALYNDNSIGQLEETQRMRKTLIKTRQELEKMIEENLKLKLALKNKMKLEENRWRDLLREKLLEMQGRNDEIENLRLELLKHKQETSALSKQLHKSSIIQDNKDKEIEMLNFSVKKENDINYCIVHKESMEHFKLQLKEERERNKYLLKCCNEMDGKIIKSKRETEICKKINSEFEERERSLQERVAEMKSEIASKNCTLKRLKEMIKELKLKNESRKEEICDKEHEIDLCSIKIEKVEQRLVHMKELNAKLENENSIWRKKFLQAQFDLHESLETIRYGNFDKTLKGKDEDEECRPSCIGCIEGDNEIQQLNEDRRMLMVKNEILSKELEHLKYDKEKLTAKLEKTIEEHKYELNEYERKLATATKELTKEENMQRDWQNEFRLLTQEIEQFKSKIECVLGERDLDSIEKEINKIKEEATFLYRENRELKNIKRTSEDKSEMNNCKINELEVRLKEIEEESDWTNDELKKKDKEIQDKDYLLKDLEAKLEAKLRYTVLF